MKRFALPLVLAALAPLPAAAANPLHDGIPAWSAEGSGVSVDIRGRLYYDIADGDLNFATPGLDFSDEEWRAARIGADIDLGPDVSITAEFDFAGNDFQPADLVAKWGAGEGLTLMAGHFKEAASLQEQTSSRFTAFMERGSITDAFGLSRRAGVGAALSGENWSWTSAAQAGTMNGLDVQGDGWALSSRASFAPVLADDRYVHLGASIRYRDHGGSADPLIRYRQRPLSHLAPRPLATARFAESDLWLGVEAAAARGPLHAEAEYARLDADGAAGDATLSGGYIQLGWYLTGETRTYEANKGRFNRTKPARPLGRGGFGAVELAARYDWVDLQDGAAAGGDQTGWTLGLNWLPTARTRVALNYIDAEIDGGPFGSGDAEIVQMRLQIDW